MSESNPVLKVIHFLKPSGYRLISSPLLISGMTFNFPAILVGPENTSDIVLVADTAIEDNNDILRQVLAVGRALDIAQKNNPLTTIIVGPRPEQSLILTMMSVCRVLPVGALPSENSEKILTNWLSILTPLAQESKSIIVDPLGDLIFEASDLRSDIVDIANISMEGVESVKNAINALITSDFENLLEDNS